MTTTGNISILEKRAENRFLLALFFFIFCILSSAWIHFYNMSVSKEIRGIEENLSQVKKSIADREADPLIQSYLLYETHKSIFERLAYESEISTFVEHIKTIALRYGIEFRWFAYNQWDITTNIRSDNDARWFWYQKVTTFLRDYRDDENALFDLNSVNAFRWHDRIEYALTLRLQQNNSILWEVSNDSETEWDTQESDSEDNETTE